MSRDPRLYFEDILKACQKIMRFTTRMDMADFIKDERTYDAVIRNLEIIGEAARNIPVEIQAQWPQISWREINAMRNVVAHEYFGIKDEIIWDMIQKEVPALLKDIVLLLQAYKRD
jgi:uncharacterized protein with HEPN domain